jgi:hypothetical protein
MVATITKQFRGKTRDAYLDLIRRFPHASIRSEEDFKPAQKVMDRLLA